MTTKETLTDNESLIQEALRDAKLVDLPSGLKKNPVIHKGDETLDAPMTVKELSSAGYVYVWDSRTFERAPVLYYMLPSILRRRREDGSFIWTTNDPKQLPKKGTHKCLLHKDSPNRERFDEMGLRVCKKSNIINKFEVKQHMSKKHPKEWQAIEDMRKEAERQEDRSFQKTLYEAVGGKKEVTEAPLYVSAKDKAKIK
ncbi:hypothetical protein LCGC14_0405940 [marine sediment metagenome]|uniref:Uncharacterized protein n=1 Tax=marine sediment metagenome TaxID=412755 RepID=A0A0F9SV85_9ZZZZ